MALDESRHLLYLVNNNGNRVDVYDYVANSVVGSISVGQSPLGAAMSSDSSYLYVANHGDKTLSVITLGGSGYGSAATPVTLPAAPQGVETELSGRVIVCTDGSGTGSASNTLLIYDPSLPSGSQVLSVVVPPPAATPPTLAPVTARPTSAINGRLRRTPDGNYIIGVSGVTVGTTANASTVVYVYEPASSTVLRTRTVVGQSSTLSIAPNSATFMAGYTMYDIATLNVLAQQNIANAPFTMTSAFSTVANVGGSMFSPDGSTLYSAFNTAPTTVPAQTAQASTLLISDPASLGIRLGINLPESIIDKMVMTSSGSDVWALSLSGVTHLPLSTLYSRPILMPSATTVFLAQDPCHPGLVQATVNVNNIGGGTLTYAVPSTIPSGAAALEVSASSGLAPATLTFTLDPGSSGVIRVPGTNLYSGGGASNSGTPVNIQLASTTAINVPPVIRVFMNYRDSTQRGLIYPVPTAPNSSVASNTGLQNLVLDPVRSRVYITNAGYNRIEVFDTLNRVFLTPISVGQLPGQMALDLDGTTLYVADAGGETVAVVNLDQMAVVNRIVFPPYPLAATSAITSVSSLAAGLSGLEMVLSNGNLWEVSANQAVPRVGTSVTGISATGAQTAITGPPRAMLASPDGTYIVLVASNGVAYRYNGLTDLYEASRQLITSTAITGYYGPLGISPGDNYFLVNGLVANTSLTAIGGATAPGLTTITPPGTTGAVQAVLRNVAAVAPVDQNYFVRLTTPVRASVTATITDDVHTTLEAVDTRSGASAVAAEMPENPIFSLFGTTRTNIPPQQMAVDSAGTVYALTISGLSVAPIAAASTATQPVVATSNGVVNATTGKTAVAPGGFLKITGTNLASTATATTLPTPTVLGGSCVLVDGVAIPLLTASPTQITGQLPTSIRPGLSVIEVKSLWMAQQSAPMVVTISKP